LTFDLVDIKKQDEISYKRTDIRYPGPKLAIKRLILGIQDFVDIKKQDEISYKRTEIRYPGPKLAIRRLIQDFVPVYCNSYY